MQTYETTDLNLACALITLGYEKQEVPMGGRRIKFVFDISAKEVAEKFEVGKLLVDARAYSATLKSIKSRL